MKTYNIVSIDEFKTNIENNSRLLGIDPGNKNIGFAICDENKKVATPLKILQKNKFEVLISALKESDSFRTRRWYETRPITKETTSIPSLQRPGRLLHRSWASKHKVSGAVFENVEMLSKHSKN